MGEEFSDRIPARGISMGWPAVLSHLKTLLETGKPIPGTDQRRH